MSTLNIGRARETACGNMSRILKINNGRECVDSSYTLGICLLGMKT